MTRIYFPRHEEHPQPLTASVERRVRFEEVDALGIVWHGRYPSYLEDARVALGNRYGIGYLEFARQGVATPIKKLHLDFVKPLRFEELFTVTAILHWSDAAKLTIEYRLHNSAGELATSGYTIQLMLDREGNLLMVPPPFYADFRGRWQAGGLI